MDVQEIVEIECYSPEGMKKSMEESMERLHSSNINAKQPATMPGNEHFHQESGNLV